MKTQRDFIVIGSGIAGLNTALTLAPYGTVLLVTKNKISDSSTSYAQGGIAAVTNEKDSIASHISDTNTAGSFYNDTKAVSLLAQNGKRAIEQLIRLGVTFDKNPDGSFATSFEAAHSFPRIFHASDFTGQKVEQTLITAVSSQKKIEVWEHAFALDLLVSQNQCLGVQILKDESILSVFSRGTIVATGGIGQLYHWTTNPKVATGDGIAMAYRAGAKVNDLEFIQFHPTALREQASPLFLLSEALRGEGAILRDSNGKRFMQEFHPLKELAPRDIVARAIFQKQKKGNIYLDMTHSNTRLIQKRFSNIYSSLSSRGLNLTHDLIPVTPAAHFICGGIVTDLYGKTSVKNLFAYGEVAATGVHGANRLASNSLLEGMVFSSRITHCLKSLPKKIDTCSLPRLIYRNEPPDNTIRNNVQKIMWDHVGIERNQKGLSYASKILKTLHEKLQAAQVVNLHRAELKNIVLTAFLIADAAYKRKQSLGTHYLRQ